MDSEVTPHKNRTLWFNQETGIYREMNLQKSLKAKFKASGEHGQEVTGDPHHEECFKKAEKIE